MRKKQYKKITGIILIIFSFFLFLFAKNNIKKQDIVFTQEQYVSDARISSSTSQESKDIFKKNIESSAKEKNNSKSYIKIGEAVFEVEHISGMTVYDAMKVLQQKNKILFEGKEYMGLGFFVTSVNSLKNGNGKYLMYYINGQEASVGVSSYVLQEGDIIEWKLE